jgi:hypothetical protein
MLPPAVAFVHKNTVVVDIKTQLMPEKTQIWLAAALERANAFTRKQVVKSASLPRADRELLMERRYLQEICKGWYILSRLVEKPEDSTAWYAAFWDFLSVYLEERFGTDYCLPEQVGLIRCRRSPRHRPTSPIEIYAGMPSLRRHTLEDGISRLCRVCRMEASQHRTSSQLSAH